MAQRAPTLFQPDNFHVPTRYVVLAIENSQWVYLVRRCYYHVAKGDAALDGAPHGDRHPVSTRFVSQTLDLLFLALLFSLHFLIITS